MHRLLDVAAGCEDVFGLYEPFYREFLVTFPPWEGVFALEMVPAALAICTIAKGDAKHAIVGAANLGRDSDTITGMVGELMGALDTIDALPETWVDQVVRLNPEPDMAQMAEDLCVLIGERAQAQGDRARTLQSLL